MRRTSIWAIFALAVLGLLAGAWATQGLTTPARAAARLAPSTGRGDGPLGTTPTATVSNTPAPAASATPTPGVICVANFRDVATEYWAYGYIEWIFCHNLITGYDCGAGCTEYRPE